MKTAHKRLETLEARKRPRAYVDVIQARDDFFIPVIEATCGSDCSERTHEYIRWWDCKRLWDAVTAAASQLDKSDPRARAQLVGVNARRYKRELRAVRQAAPSNNISFFRNHGKTGYDRNS